MRGPGPAAYLDRVLLMRSRRKCRKSWGVQK